LNINSNFYSLTVFIADIMSAFAVPDGTFFDPNFGLDCAQDGDTERIDRALPGLVEEGNKILQKYGFEPISQADVVKPIHEISSEVGDDEECYSNNKAFIALVPVMHMRAGMKISWKDTSINSRFGNFAEDLVLLPDGYYQTYHNARKTSSHFEMAYLDVCKLRLAIDIRPMRMDHSGTNDGKAAMVGSRNAWIPFNSPIKGIYEIFSLYQDINLGFIRDKKFAYLPQQLGGYGKPIPFMEPSNFERFNKAFRQGTYASLHREIVRRTIVWLHNESLGFEQEKDPLLSHIVRFETSFHDWIKNKSIYAPVTWLEIPDYLSQYIAGRTSEDKRKNTAMQRLAADGDLVTEQQLEIAVEHNELCRSLLGEENVASFKKKRDEKIAEWKKLSIYSLLQMGQIRELRLEGLGLRELRPIEILRFHSLVRDKGKALKMALRDEAYYWPEALRAVYERGPMSVSFSCAPLTRVGFTIAERRVDMEDPEEGPKEHEELREWLRKGARGKMPTKLVNDDIPLIEEAQESSLVVIVTDDKALCRDMNRIKGCPVFRVPCEWYFRSLYFGEADQPWLAYCRKNFPAFLTQSMIDTGSVTSFEETYFKDGVLSSKKIRQPLNIFKEPGVKDKIDMEESERFDDGPPEGDPRTFLYDRKNVLRSRPQRRKAYYKA
jgi:hypothetical protein